MSRLARSPIGEVISSPVALVPTNALVLIGLRNFLAVGYPEALAEIKPLRGQNGTFGMDIEIKKRFWFSRSAFCFSSCG